MTLGSTLTEMSTRNVSWVKGVRLVRLTTSPQSLCRLPKNMGASTSHNLMGSTALQPFGPWPLSQFLNLYTVGRTPWTGDQPVARPLHKQDNTTI
jgi:hypothetical protein